MDTKEKLEIALKEALKAGDDVRKRSIRMAGGCPPGGD